MEVGFVTVGAAASVMLATRLRYGSLITIGIMAAAMFASHFIGDMFADAQLKSCRVVTAATSAAIGTLAYILLVKRLPRIHNSVTAKLGPQLSMVGSVSLAVLVWNVVNMYVLGNRCTM